MAKRGRKPGTGRTATNSRAGQKPAAETPPLSDYRHAATRKNNPPAKIAAEGTVPVIPKAQYAYNPHLPPVLRFDPAGGPDTLPELLAKARTSPLSEEEARLLAAGPCASTSRGWSGPASARSRRSRSIRSPCTSTSASARRPF